MYLKLEDDQPSNQQKKPSENSKVEPPQRQSQVQYQQPQYQQPQYQPRPPQASIYRVSRQTGPVQITINPYQPPVIQTPQKKRSPIPDMYN